MSGKTNLFRIVFAVAILAMVTIGGIADAGTKVKGTLYSIDPAANSVTLKTNGILTTLNLSATTKIIRNKAVTSVNGMVLGDKVIAAYKQSSLNPSKLKATGAKVTQIQGKVTGISPSGVVQLSTGSFTTSVQTRIVRNGRVSSLDSIAMGDDVVAHMENENEAEDIESEGTEESEVRGTITAVDVANSTVTFTDALGISITVNVTADTMIELGDATATINDLTVGLLVEVHYDPLTFNAFRIEAEDENEDAEIEGTITAVDPAAGTVTIQDAQGVSVTVTADAGTMIERDDEPAFLSDLLVGDQGKAEYDVNSLVANEIEVESPGSDDDSL
jgi:Cu/Ag efflux protein CusF